MGTFPNIHGNTKGKLLQNVETPSEHRGERAPFRGSEKERGFSSIPAKFTWGKSPSHFPSWFCWCYSLRGRSGESGPLCVHGNGSRHIPMAFPWEWLTWPPGRQPRSPALDLVELEQSPGAQSSGIVVIPPFLALVLGQTFLAWQLQGIMESWNALGGKGS